MNKEFEKFWSELDDNSKFKIYNEDIIAWFKIGRECSKKQILDILNKHIQPIIDTQLQREAENFIHLDAIKEIEKL